METTTNEIPQELYDFLTEEMYLDLRLVPGRGVCGLSLMLFTVGVCYGLDFFVSEGRYCYHSLAEARHALKTWDGKEHPPGNWIKHKGVGVDEGNPNYKK